MTAYVVAKVLYTNIDFLKSSMKSSHHIDLWIKSIGALQKQIQCDVHFQKLVSSENLAFFQGFGALFFGQT